MCDVELCLVRPRSILTLDNYFAAQLIVMLLSTKVSWVDSCAGRRKTWSGFDLWSRRRVLVRCSFHGSVISISHVLVCRLLMCRAFVDGVTVLRYWFKFVLDCCIFYMLWMQRERERCMCDEGLKERINTSFASMCIFDFTVPCWMCF